MNRDELVDLRKQVDKALKSYEKRKLEEARREAAKAAAEFGYSLNDLRGGDKGKPKGAKLPPKYAHPDQPGLTYSGRGRKPKWLQERLDAGASLDDFLIK